MRNMKLALAGLAFAAGCALPQTASAESVTGATAPVELVFKSNRLDRAIVVGAPVIDHVGPLQRVALSLENSSRKATKIEYRVEWFDESGAPAGTSLAWKTVFLDSKESKSIQEVAQRATAASARIFVRDVGAAE